MRELTLHGLHDDGEHLVLNDSDGASYLLTIDEALRAAVRRDRPALGLIQATEASSVRPKDIQAMLRSGHTVEEISEMSGLAAEDIRRFEGPVLAERSYMARQAQQFHLGRGSSDKLGEVVTSRLHARRVEQEPNWDAWRRPDGTWTLLMQFSAGSRARTAQWQLDVPNRIAHAEDDEARWLSDSEEAIAEDQPRTRLRAVRNQVFDVEAADRGLGRGGAADVPAPVRGQHPSAQQGAAGQARPQGQQGPRPITDEELDRINAQRGVRPVPQAQSDAPTPGAGEGSESSASASSPWVSLTESDDLPSRDTGEDLGTMPTDDMSAITAPDDLDSDIDRARAQRDAATSADVPTPVHPAHTADDDAAAEYAAESARSEHADADSQEDPDGDSGSGHSSSDEYDGDDHSSDDSGSAGADEDSQESEDEGLSTEDLEPLPGFEKPKKKPEKRRRGRSSIPSWDDIVFGTKDR